MCASLIFVTSVMNRQMEAPQSFLVKGQKQQMGGKKSVKNAGEDEAEISGV